MFGCRGNGPNNFDFVCNPLYTRDKDMHHEEVINGANEFKCMLKSYSQNDYCLFTATQKSKPPSREHILALGTKSSALAFHLWT